MLAAKRRTVSLLPWLSFQKTGLAALLLTLEHSIPCWPSTKQPCYYAMAELCVNRFRKKNHKKLSAVNLLLQFTEHSELVVQGLKVELIDSATDRGDIVKGKKRMCYAKIRFSRA